MSLLCGAGSSWYSRTWHQSRVRRLRLLGRLRQFRHPVIRAVPARLCRNKSQARAMPTVLAPSHGRSMHVCLSVYLTCSALCPIIVGSAGSTVRAGSRLFRSFAYRLDRALRRRRCALAHPHRRARASGSPHVSGTPHSSGGRGMRAHCLACSDCSCFRLKLQLSGGAGTTFSASS